MTTANPTTLTKGRRALLAILADCPDGATTGALASNCGISLNDMMAVIRAGYASAERQRFAHPCVRDLVVMRMRITEAGREKL